MSMFRGFCALALLFLSGCAPTRPTETPIPMVFYAGEAGPKDQLLIFLPGRGDDMSVFESSGLIDILHQSNAAIDSVVVDAHMGYYIDGSLAGRMYQDVLLPFQARGYRHFIIVGASLGGFGALWINHEYPDLVSSLVLLAPYLGSESLIEDIESSGGIHAWRSQLDHEPEKAEKTWFWIDDMRMQDPAELGTIFLGVGQKDRFSKAAALLASMLGESQVFGNDGGHDWTTWRSLFSDITKSQKWELLGYTDREGNQINADKVKSDDE